MNNFRIYALYRPTQPIVHTEETIGNISKIKKMRVIYEGKSTPVPALSGNSFRGQLRDILADQMFAILTDDGDKYINLKPDYYGVLYSGGILKEGSKMGEQMKQLAEAIPFLRLMGSAFGNVMLPSKLAVTHIMPYAIETRHLVESVVTQLPEAWQRLFPDDPPRGRDLIFNDGPLTRKDDSKDLTKQRYARTEAEFSADEDKKKERQQMIYYIECIPPGTLLLQEMYSKYALDNLELGCFFDGLLAFLKHPSLGGRSAAGYGQVQVQYKVELDDSELFEMTTESNIDMPETALDSIRTYRQHVKEKRKDIVAALEGSLEKGEDESAQESRS